MSQQHLGAGSTAKGMRFTDLFKMGLTVETLSGGIDLDAEDPPVHFLDPGGAGRNVDLPDMTASDYEDEGVMFIIINTADAAETLTIRDGANSDSTVDSVNQHGLGMFFWDKAAGQWRGMAVVGA